ncbi:MAG TPA: type IV pilus biogenesis/stability protein PilW [Gammaproteobacteria bacterium]|nr:type IV pilus biogenesis/stability protein PilW [Gammaproteobacteria bacterium]
MRRLIVVLLVAALFSLAGCSSSPQKKVKGGDLKQDPAAVNTQLGIEYMRNGMYDTALEKFKKALRENPRLQAAHASIAILYEQLGETDDAAKHYRKAYRLNPDDPVNLNNYGQFLCRQGELEKADEMFLRALKDPLYRYPEAVLTNAGICAMKKPDMEKAEKYFRAALKRSKSYVPALRNMIRVSFAEKKYLATRAYLQRLQAVQPLTPELLWIGVQTENEMGDRHAVSSYSMLLKNKYPESEEAQKLVEWERKSNGR